MLIQLPNNEWVKPEEVTFIGFHGCYSEPYILVCRQNGMSVWLADDVPTGQAQIDSISEQVNAALYREGKK